MALKLGGFKLLAFDSKPWQVFHQPTSQWFEIHDLRVTPVLPQMVALTESYIQVYQRQDVKPDGSFGKFDAEIPELLAEALRTVEDSRTRLRSGGGPRRGRRDRDGARGPGGSRHHHRLSYLTCAPRKRGGGGLGRPRPRARGVTRRFPASGPRVISKCERQRPWRTSRERPLDMKWKNTRRHFFFNHVMLVILHLAIGLHAQQGASIRLLC